MPYLRTLRHANAGFTMIEILVATAILGILLLVVLLNAPRYITKGQDAERKNDLAAYHLAFEQYYEDHHCYPPRTVLQTCGSTTTSLAPYLRKILCDPRTHNPYQYETVGSVNCPTAFRMFVLLDDTTDPGIQETGCTAGCGPASSKSYNYGVGSGNVVVGSPTITLPGLSAGQATPTNCYLVNGQQVCSCPIGAGCGTQCPGVMRCGPDGTYCITDPSCQ